MSSLDSLAHIFTQFPGIGQRQARRFAYFLRSRDPRFIEKLISELKELHASVAICPSCFRLFGKQGTQSQCSHCSDTNRDITQLMVVQRDADLDAIEKTGIYKGYYFVLGGGVPVLEKNPHERIRLKDFLAVIEHRLPTGLQEIIFALNANPEGENTEDIVRNELKSILEKAANSITLSRLGRGISTGTELEYVDSSTLQSALSNRKS